MTCGSGRVVAAKANPYLVIAAHNVFHLLPFSARRHSVQKPSPKILPKIVITGITDICGHREVLAEISELGKPTLRPVLVEGQALGSVEVLQIYPKQARVKMRICGEESILSLRAAPPAPPPTRSVRGPARGPVRG